MLKANMLLSHRELLNKIIDTFLQRNIMLGRVGMSLSDNEFCATSKKCRDLRRIKINLPNIVK